MTEQQSGLVVRNILALPVSIYDKRVGTVIIRYSINGGGEEIAVRCAANSKPGRNEWWERVGEYNPIRDMSLTEELDRRLRNFLESQGIEDGIVS